MTKASEVTVSDAEMERYERRYEELRAQYPENVTECLRRALQELIAARVPDAVADQGDDSYPSFGVWEAGHNACRAAVMRGLDQ